MFCCEARNHFASQIAINVCLLESNYWIGCDCCFVLRCVGSDLRSGWNMCVAADELELCDVFFGVMVVC